MLTKPLLRDELTEQLREFALRQQSTVPVRVSAERQLAEELGVSRISVRHAIKSLVDEGILTQKQGSGTFVVPIKDVSGVQVLMANDIKSQDPFFNEFLTEMTHHCASHAIQLRVTRAPVGDGQLGGNEPLIIVGLVPEPVVRKLKATGRMVVSTQYYPDSLDISQLVFDDYHIGWEAAEILVRRGHERVIHLRGPRSFPSAHERANGFEANAERRSISVTTLSGKMNWASGYALGAQVITHMQGPNAPTAIFASNDWMAFGLLQLFGEQQVQVPADVSVIGCDDIHLAAEIKPGLATFRWDMPFMVSELFNVINSEFGTPVETHKRILIPARFIDRPSLAPRSQRPAGESTQESG